MKHSKLILLALTACLLLMASGGLAANDKKAQRPDAKATAVGQDRTAVQPSAASPAAGEEINWQVISSGDTEGASTSFSLNGTAGQAVVGTGGSTSYGLCHGFWQDFSGGSVGCCVGLTGNVDNDPTDMVDLSDLTALIDYLFISFTVPVCIEEANCDGDPAGLVDLGDLTALIDYLFISFTPPAPCQ